MHADDYLHATPEELGKHALVLARQSDTVGFQALLVGIEGHKQYMDVETAITGTLLAHDCVEMYRESFELGYMAQWCRDNIAHVVRHCPNTVQVWALGGPERPNKVIELVARELGRMPADERLRVLRGDFSMPFVGYPRTWSQELLYTHIGAKTHYWRELSPAWLSTPELKQAARERGWSEKHLPAMVYRNMWEIGHAAWIASVPFAYTLMACEMYRHAQQFGAHAPTPPETITCEAGTQAVDIALAKRIMASSPHPCKLSLRRPPSVKALDADTERQIDGFVQAHVMMDTLGSLALDLARGVPLRLQAEEAVELPDLMDDVSTAGPLA